MRIAIYSPHYAFNYGAMLQAFALKHYLRNLGFDAVILNRRPPQYYAIPSFKGRLVRKLEEFAKRSSFIAFDKKYLQPQTQLVVKQEDWKGFPFEELDAVIVGSDQMWRDDYCFNSFRFNTFLDFLDGHDILRISYAPSLGHAKWEAPAYMPEGTENRVRELLQKFDAISVREESSIRVLKDKFGVDAELVVDPTLLLTAEDYISAFNIPQGKKRYIASYILDFDDVFKSKLKSLSSSLNLPLQGINITPSKGRFSYLLNRFTPMTPVAKWVENIANAEYVVTNSFHGAVFSIIFRKQFVVVMNCQRGAERFKSLLGMFGLEDRLIEKTDDFEKILTTPIDFTRIDPLINSWRYRSAAFLHKALGNMDC